MLSFSETEYAKRVVLVNMEKSGVSSITSLSIPVFRRLFDWTGTFDEIQQKMDEFKVSDGLTPWIKVNVREEKIQGNEYARLLEMIQTAQTNWNGTAQILDHSLQFIAETPQTIVNQGTVAADMVTPELIFELMFDEDRFEYMEILKELFDGILDEIQLNEGGER
jgi:hypothetical protein